MKIQAMIPHDPKKVAEQIRETAREIVGNTENWTHRSKFFKQWIKPFLWGQRKHDSKKKFLNAEEAMWWAGENLQYPMRAYRCPVCPFWHLTSKI